MRASRIFYALYALSTLLSAVISTNVSAQAIDLLQLYHAAEANDPVFASARAQRLANNEKTPQGRAGLLPQITGQWSHGKNNGSTQVAAATLKNDFTQTTWAIALTQPLFRWENWQNYKQSELLAITAQAQFSQAQQDIILRVSQAYFDLLTAQDNLRLANTKQHSIEEQLAQAKRNFEIGTATIVDTHEAQARYDLAQAQKIAANSELEIKRGALSEITGTPIDLNVPTINRSQQLSIPTLSALEDWLNQAKRDNLQVAIAQTAVEIARREHSKTRGGHLPAVDLIASRSYSNTKTNETVEQSISSASPIGKTFNNQIKLQLTLPLFSGGYTQSHLRETQALLSKASEDLQAAQRRATQTARSAFMNVSSGLAQLKALEAAEQSALSAYDSNKVGYEVGVRINIDVLNAQEQLTSTRRDLYKAHYDVLMAYLTLKSTVNTLDENDLIWLNSRLTATLSNNQ